MIVKLSNVLEIPVWLPHLFCRRQQPESEAELDAAPVVLAWRDRGPAGVAIEGHAAPIDTGASMQIYSRGEAGAVVRGAQEGDIHG